MLSPLNPQPLVSILIPCYNAEPWLAETIASAIAQTWQNKEIIVVDDGSTDGSLAIAKGFQSEIVKVISQANWGASAARNSAFQVSRGAFIQYLDADDLLAPDKIERQISRFSLDLLDPSQAPPDYVVTCEWARFYQTPDEALFIPQPLWQDLLPVDWLICAWQGNWMMHPAAWLVPRHIAKSAGDWNEQLSLDDDGEYFSRVVLASQAIAFCQGAKTYYRSGMAGSLSKAKSPTALKSAFSSIELRTSCLLAKETSDRTRHACARLYQYFVAGVYPEALDLVGQAEQRVKQLGGSPWRPKEGLLFELFASAIGWRSARWLRHFLQKYGWGKLPMGWKFYLFLQQWNYKNKNLTN
ncbi:Glycosyltransferase 2-like domain-containing protein [Tumidithrix helvetica PCC 7403]|uniref:glycosyltransferase family 2 protein n=1 Tax=Tumidithrix helvetica TaxID=3457545 RepID=UPI003CA520DD